MVVPKVYFWLCFDFAQILVDIGFKGQARIIIPKYTACYECSLDMQTQAKTYPICTIANTPRLPEHCIEYASVLEWPKVWKGKNGFNNFSV